MAADGGIRERDHLLLGDTEPVLGFIPFDCKDSREISTIPELEDPEEIARGSIIFTRTCTLDIPLRAPYQMEPEEGLETDPGGDEPGEDTLSVVQPGFEYIHSVDVEHRKTEATPSSTMQTSFVWVGIATVYNEQRVIAVDDRLLLGRVAPDFGFALFVSSDGIIRPADQDYYQFIKGEWVKIMFRSDEQVVREVVPQWKMDEILPSINAAYRTALRDNHLMY